MPFGIIILFVGRARCVRLTLPNCVKVARMTLTHLVLVRIQVRQPSFAAMVKRLRRRPLTAKTGVRVPVAVLEKSRKRLFFFILISLQKASAR